MEILLTRKTGGFAPLREKFWTVDGYTTLSACTAYDRNRTLTAKVVIRHIDEAR